MSWKKKREPTTTPLTAEAVKRIICISLIPPCAFKKKKKKNLCTLFISLKRVFGVVVHRADARRKAFPEPRAPPYTRIPLYLPFCRAHLFGGIYLLFVTTKRFSFYLPSLLVRPMHAKIIWLGHHVWLRPLIIFGMIWNLMVIFYLFYFILNQGDVTNQKKKVRSISFNDVVSRR